MESENAYILVLSVRLYCMMKADEMTAPMEFTPSVVSDNGLAANDVSDTGLSCSRCQLSFTRFAYHEQHHCCCRFIMCLKPKINNTAKRQIASKL